MNSPARGSSSGLSLRGPTKVKACKSFLFHKQHAIYHVVDYLIKPVPKPVSSAPETIRSIHRSYTEKI